MKEQLDENSIKSLVAYRINRAYETLNEARYMIDGEYYNAAVNRLYYSCFYAVLALLLQNGIQSQTHKGVKSMLGLHFVATGKLSSLYGGIYSTLFEKRHSNDYDDFVYCDRDLVEQLLPSATQFIQAIEQLIYLPEL